MNQNTKIRITQIKSFHTPAQILSEEDQNALMQCRAELLTNYFKIGDIANRNIATDIDAGLPITQMQVYEAVSRFCGKSPRTVRYYAEVAIYYSRQDRLQYDVLPFSHFVVAKKLGGDIEGGPWTVLDYAMDHPYLSAEELENRFRYGDPEYQPPEEPDEEGVTAIVGRIEYVIDTLDRLVRAWRLKPGTLAKITDSLDGLRAALKLAIEESREK